MARRQSILACVLAVASCGVRAPPPIDLAALVARRGEIAARHDLEVRIVADSLDLSARLALAALAERSQLPSQAIEQLEAVIAIGGPIGTRWRADDRARLGRLLAARGRARLDREAATAYADLVRARDLGVTIGTTELANARLARALAQLRRVDAESRAAGKRALVELAATPIGEPSWRAAGATPAPHDRGALGLWLWNRGAKRAAWDELRAWHDAGAARGAPSGIDAIAAAYLEARTWWVPSDAPGPDAADLVGPLRCRYVTVGDCAIAELVHGEPRDDTALDAAQGVALERTAAAADATAWMIATLLRSLRGDAPWGPAFAARVDLVDVAPAAIEPAFRATYARIAGYGDAPEGQLSDHELARGRPFTPAERVAIAAGRALRSATAIEVREALGGAADSYEGRALLAVVAPRTAEPIANPYAAAVVAHVRARIPRGLDAAALRGVVDAYHRDPTAADRVAIDVTRRAVDAAIAYAALGTLYVAIGDPARARKAWQAAVDSSPDPEFLRGLAEAIARVHDPDAALIAATTAAAASGDPATVWNAVAKALLGTGEARHALEAGRSAIDLASSEALVEALDIAIDASRALERVDQVDAMLVRRARLGPAIARERDGDPTSAGSALAEFRQSPTASAVARLWVASRWNSRDVAIRGALRGATSADDPRHDVVVAELVALASDRDPDVGRAAVAALR